MPAVSDKDQLARRVQEIAAELDRAVRQVQAVDGAVRASIGSSATGADERMLGALGRVSASAREAQQTLSAAAGGLMTVRPRREP